jgi:uncharacterized protein (TIGR02588 family)
MPEVEGRRAEPSAGGDAASTPGRALPVSEWLVAALGAIMVLGAIAQLIYHSVGREQSPPDIRVVAERVVELRQGYLVQFRARNDGQSAAAEVEIEGELAAPDGASEVSEATLDYLPPRSEREGGLFFARDPRAGQLQLRATGFAAP